MGAPKRTFSDKLGKPQMLASVVASTVAYANARGVDMEQISQATGLTRADLLNPDARLPQDALPTVWRLLSKIYPGEVLALHMASATPFSFFGTLAYGTKYAENFREALQSMVRHRALLSDKLHLKLVESDTEATLQVYHPMDAEDGGCAAEVGLALCWRFMLEVIGVKEGLVRVEFTHKPFGAISVYQEFFGVPVCFQKGYNSLVFRKDALELPTKEPDPNLFSYIQSHLDLARERSKVADEPEGLCEIREAIAHNAEKSQYGAQELARQMNISLRGLQRLVQGYDTTVRQLLDEAREANAVEFLKDSRLSIEAISSLLGYSEDRAFRRAFKRWTGKTPAEFRRSMES